METPPLGAAPRQTVGDVPPAIQRLLGRARFRIRSQWALEGATTAIIIAAAAALVAVFAIRLDWVSTLTGTLLLIGAGAIVLIGAAASAARRLDDEAVARRIDRASNLSDRLSTAIAFRRALAASSGTPVEADETYDLMLAAIRDGVACAPRADVRAATPFVAPRDLRAALGFLAVSALAAGLAVPTVDHSPHLFGASPDHGPPGIEVLLRGDNLMTGVATPFAALPSAAAHVIGAPNLPAEPAAMEARGFVPVDAKVMMGPADKPRQITVLDWSRDTIKIRIPADAAYGETELSVQMPDGELLGPIPFTVDDPKDVNNFNKDAVIFDPDEKAYIEGIIAELRRIARRDNVPELEEFAAKIEQMMKDAEEGKITKEQLLEALQKAEEALNMRAEPNPDELAKQMSELGKELTKSELTKELGQALKDNQLDKAKQELEELARKLDKSQQQKELEQLEQQLKDKQLTEQEKQELQKKIDQLKQEMEKQQNELEKQLEQQLKDNKELTEQEKQQLQKQLDQLKQEKPLTEQQKQELQKQLDKVAKQMEQQQKQQQQKAEQQKQQLEDQIRRLQREKDQAKNDQDRLDAERRLQQKKEELQKLQKDQDQKQQSAQREAVKRLQRDIEKAAEQLKKPDKQESQDEQEERERQASQKLKDAARETGRVDQDRRKQATQKKMSSQMEELREAMQRAKQKGNKGPQDPFNKNGKNKDFNARARGGKGQGQVWKPGQGQGQGQNGQQGQGNGGKQWGVGTGGPLDGAPTDKSGNTKDADLEAKTQGEKGGSRRETILSAAQKGFASTSYKKVYQDYQKIVEDVMRTEKLPSSYKYYVKRYFAKIHPSGASDVIEKDNQ